MKRCPTCQKTFDDSLWFCQIDGSALVDDGAASNPLQTLTGAPPISDGEDDLLQLDGVEDETKTLVSYPDFQSPKSSPDEFKSENFPPFDDFSTVLPPDSNRFSDGLSSGNSSPSFGAPQSAPFDSSSFQSPAAPFSDPPPRDAPNAPFNQNPFDAAQNQYGQPLQQHSWAPPPAPEAAWQNQNIGANTPFQPPMISRGQDQTLPIVSLVLGIISIMCCFVGFLTGPAALITGYLGKKNADKNPNEYGGSGMAIAGMITGGIGALISIGYFLIIIIGAINDSVR